jgi:hypothetical protein
METFCPGNVLCRNVLYVRHIISFIAGYKARYRYPAISLGKSNQVFGWTPDIKKAGSPVYLLFLVMK